MANVEIYTKTFCPYCIRAKADLDRKGVSYREIDVTADPLDELEMVMRSDCRTVPQIFIDDHHLGGSDDLRAADASGELDQLLAGSLDLLAA